MRSIFVILFVFTISSNCDSATPLTSKEIGVFIGESYYLGELNKIHFTPFNLAASAYYRYNYDDRIGLRTQLSYGKIEGSDATSTNEFENARGLSFNSSIFELSGMGEFNFFNFSYLSPKSYKITPYAFLGIGIFYHHHAGIFAEGTKYKNIQAAIPLGLGLKYGFGKFGLALEWGIRKTFTDYLDDVSKYYSSSDRTLANFQRGEEFNKDWYVFTGLSLFINLTPKRQCPN